MYLIKAYNSQYQWFSRYPVATANKDKAFPVTTRHQVQRHVEPLPNAQAKLKGDYNVPTSETPERLRCLCIVTVCIKFLELRLRVHDGTYTSYWLLIRVNHFTQQAALAFDRDSIR